MSIFSDYQVYVPSLERYVTIATHESFIGRVVSQFAKVERIMSDVWDNVYYATVLTENGDLQDVRLGCTEFPRDHATVDASDEALALADARRKQIYEERQARERAATEARNAQLARAREAERIRRESLPKNGDVVEIRVDRRCRNPELLRNNGKSGRIFWVRNERYGVALSDERDNRGFFTNVVWARASQLVVDDSYC